MRTSHLFLSLAWLLLLAGRAAGQYHTTITVPPKQPDSISHGVRLNLYDGGYISSSLDAASGSQVNVYGGEVYWGYVAESGNEVNIYGGLVYHDFVAKSGSEIHIYNGHFRPGFKAQSGSNVSFHGWEFYIDDVPVDSIYDTIDTIPVGSVLSGTYRDGTPFAFRSGFSPGTITLVKSKPSDPQPGTYYASMDDLPGVRNGQTLIVDAGSNVGDYFVAGVGSTILLTGGRIGDYFRTTGATVDITGGYLYTGYANYGSVINISGGRSSFFADNDSIINVSGGDTSFVARNDSTVNVTGGTVSGRANAGPGSRVNISGGVFDSDLKASEGSQVTISGGKLNGGINTEEGSSLRLLGDHFYVDGTLMSDLIGLGDAVQVDFPMKTSWAGSPRGTALSGVFADGTPFFFPDLNRVTYDNFIANGSLTLEHVETQPPVAQTFYASTDVLPSDLRNGQTLVVDDDGSVEAGYMASYGSEIILNEGGSIGDDLQLVTSIATLYGGIAGKNMQAFNGSEITVHGGSIDRGLLLSGGSDLTISGGTIDSLELRKGSHAAISGGTIGRPSTSGMLVIDSGSVVDFSGGSLLYTSTVRDASTLNISGGNYRGFYVLEGSTVNIFGGTIDGFAAGESSTVNVSGGELGDDVKARSNSVVNISGGSFGMNFLADDASTVSISDGRFAGNFVARVGSEIVIEGGSFGDDFHTYGSHVMITGGDFDDEFDARAGSTIGVGGGSFGDDFQVESTSSLTFSGDEFYLDGLPVTELANIDDTLSLDLPEGSLLTGTLADGTPFAFSSLDGDQIAANALVLKRASLPAIGATQFLASEHPDLLGVRRDQTFVVDLDETSRENFNAGRGSVVRVLADGVLGENLEAVGAEVAVEGGAIGDGLDLWEGSTLTINGGTVGRGLHVGSGSHVDLSTGTIADDATTAVGSSWNISGGTVGRHFEANGASIEISAGAIGSNFQGSGGTEITLSGGSLGNSAELTDGSTLDINGGNVDYNLKISNGSEVSLTGGSIGGSFRASANSLVSISGGSILGGMTVSDGTTLEMTGGSIGIGFRAYGGSIVDISGGTLSSNFQASSGSEVTISGGVFSNLSFASGSAFLVRGGDFFLDNQPIEELGDAGQQLQLDLANGAILSGTLADGTPFALSSLNSDLIAAGTLTLESTTLPAIGPTEFRASVDQLPQGIRQGQSLVVDAGSSLPVSFRAGRGSAVSIEQGGVVDAGMEAIGATIDIQGDVGASFKAFHQSEINISGEGSVGDDFLVHDGVVVAIEGGTVGDNFTVGSGSSVAMTSGSIGRNLRAEGGTDIVISGGSIGRNFDAVSGSAVRLIGGEFYLNKTPIEGLQDIGDAIAYDLANGSVLSGILTDGSPFIFTSVDSDNIETGVLMLEVAATPAIGPPVITASTDVVPATIRSGQTLIVDATGVVEAGFFAGPGSTTVVKAGGSMGSNLQTVGASVQVTGGNLGSGFAAYGTSVEISNGYVNDFSASSGSTVSLSDGLLIGYRNYLYDSELNISGGFVYADLLLTGESELNITGGAFRSRIELQSGSEANISGGELRNPNHSSAFESFRAYPGTEVNLFGTEFLLDGILITDLEQLVQNTLEDRNVTLSGKLVDGSFFSLYLNGNSFGFRDYFDANALLTLTLAPAISDFNEDFAVDGGDLLLWQAEFGTSSSTTDANGDGIADGLDFLNWQRQFTGTRDASSGSAVPEPASLALLCLATLLLSPLRRLNM